MPTLAGEPCVDGNDPSALGRDETIPKPGGSWVRVG